MINLEPESRILQWHPRVIFAQLVFSFVINSIMKIKDIVLERMISDLLEICSHELGLENFPKINLIPEPVVGQGTAFGEYTGEINIAIQNRHPMDIMRTLAHELVHARQQELGQPMDGRDGSDTENDANAVAGVIMRKFGKMYPEYFLQSMV